MEERLGSLSDRSVDFAVRVQTASAILCDASYLFPTKHQVLYDWLVGSLVKMSRFERDSHLYARPF